MLLKLLNIYNKYSIKNNQILVNTGFYCYRLLNQKQQQKKNDYLHNDGTFWPGRPGGPGGHAQLLVWFKKKALPGGPGNPWEPGEPRGPGGPSFSLFPPTSPVSPLLHLEIFKY